MRLLLFLSCLAFSASSILNAQVNQGEIIYEKKTNIHKSLPEEMQEFKDRIPEFRTAQFKLNFTPTETSYSRHKTEEDKDPERRGRRGFGGSRADIHVYMDLETKTTKESRDFFGKKFLIEGEVETIKWKMTGESKQVGSYLCQKAVFSDSTRTLEAWFTPMIPVAAGPENYINLPGMILHIDIDEGKETITALTIDLKELEEGTITRPTKGEKVSRDEFKQLVEEKMAEMEEQYGTRRGMFRSRRRG